MLRTVVFLLLGFTALVALYVGVLRWDRADGSRQSAEEPSELAAVADLIDLSTRLPDTIRFTETGLKTVGIETAQVRLAPPPEPVKLPGSILIDPNRLIRIHSRFSGELVSVGTAAGAPLRQLRYGDRVEKGQLIAVVWSKDIGEKKSELVEAISKSALDKTLLDRLESAVKADPGVVPEPRLQEARRNYEADLIAADRAVRTLQSWRMTEEEIDEVGQEAKRIKDRKVSDPLEARKWAQTEVRSPIDGIIVEKNFNVGDLIDTSQDLFKIADMSRVQVLINAYEEDLPVMRSLRPEQRNWQVEVKSDPHDVPIGVDFDTIGHLIEPAQHAGAVMGRVDNSDGRFKIGQFISATMELPADPALVVVPTSALIEDGNSTQVWLETDAQNHEFTCRKVAVVHRGRERAYIRSEPLVAEKQNGAESIKAGDLVIKSGVLELVEEMRGLQAAARGH
jgi:cobalt-zinc-cadmium efflux system membrane fusion protein